MKILFVHANSDNIAGQELSLLDRINGLTADGISCAVLLPQGGVFVDLLKKNKIPVFFCSLNRLSKKTNPFSYLQTILSITRLIKEYKFSHVHCSGCYPNQFCLPAARICGVPCIVHVSTTVYTERDLKINFVGWSDHIITVSNAARNSIIQRGKINAQKVVTIYDVIATGEANIDLDRACKLREALGITEGVKVVGQISSVIPRKGIEYFIRMARKVKDKFVNTKFLLVGPTYGDEFEKNMRQLVGDLNLVDDIVFTGFQTTPNDYINLLDVSVLASTEEGLGRVIIESMRVGKPVISANISGIEEAIVHNQTGLLVPPENPEALAEAVLSLLVNTEWARKLGEEGKALLGDKFSSKKHIDELVKVYKKVVLS